MGIDRIIIKTKDVQIIYGISRSAASRQIQIIRDALNKRPKQKLSITEFAEHEGLSEEYIEEKLRKYEPNFNK